MNKREEFNRYIQEAEKIVILGHLGPDLDAGCSCLVVSQYLNKYFPQKHVEVLLTSGGAEPLDWQFLNFFEQIKWTEEVAESINEFDVAIFMDANGVHRFSRRPESIDMQRLKSICIDHHPGEADNFDLNLSDLAAPSATQIAYEIFFREQLTEMSTELAQVVMIGIMADTGTFKFIKPDQTKTFTIVGELVERFGLDIQGLELNLSQISSQGLKVFTHLLQNQQNIELAEGKGFSASYIDPEFTKEFTSGEIAEGYEAYKFKILRQVKGYRWGFVIKRISDTECRLSFRSTPGSVNVRLIAEHYDGGGHNLAAGGTVYDSSNNIKDVFEAVINEISSMDLKIVLP